LVKVEGQKLLFVFLQKHDAEAKDCINACSKDMVEYPKDHFQWKTERLLVRYSAVSEHLLLTDRQTRSGAIESKTCST
jgi:hypothetical protein